MCNYRILFRNIKTMVLAAVIVSTVTERSQIPVSAKGEEIPITENLAFSDNEHLSDDNLFTKCVQNDFCETAKKSLFYNSKCSSNHAKVLNADELTIYSALKEAVTNIASGKQSSTEITLNNWSMPFTYAELGLNASTTEQQLQSSVKTVFNGKINIGKVLNCLLSDCPYELYWYDKVQPTMHGYRISFDGNMCTLTGLYFKMPVTSSYSSGKEYTTDVTKTKAATIAAENAQIIIEENKYKSDYEKLVAYRDKICELVSYNSEAANSNLASSGDPWQLVYVFDNNPNTNVVCEGYAKAFQYLCDLSTFTDDVFCYTVTGNIPEAHMWNHITIGNRNYLADITNCDTGTIGSPDNLFLKGMEGEISTGYTKNINSQSITYIFDSNSTELFGTGKNSVLSLSSEDYTKSAETVSDMATPSPGVNETLNPAETPVIGTKLKDADNVYIVTKITGSERTVTYKQPLNKKLRSIAIPGTVKLNNISYKVTAIASNAFKDCKKLTNITIGNNILSLGNNIFKGCKSLKSITIRSTKLAPKQVGKNAFKGVSIKATIAIPAKQYIVYKKLLRKRGVLKNTKIKKIT